MRILTVPHTPWAFLAAVVIAWAALMNHLITTERNATMATIPELIERGHTILELAPRDYSAITNLVTASYQVGQAKAWEEGFTQGAAYYHDSGKPPAAFTETAETLNPYKETSSPRNTP